MDGAKIESMIEEICQTVGGDWLLVGGALVQIAYNGDRATEDIDLIQISHAELSETKAQDELFKAAFRQGLDPESVNSAARFFLQEIPDWKRELIEIRTGARGRVFKPSLMLFMALKLKRGSSIDIQDIQAAIQSEGLEVFDENRFRELADPKSIERFEERRNAWGL